MSQDNKSSQCAVEGRPHGFGEIWRCGEEQQEKETVRRIVACVSACRGYSTEELESANLYREILALKKQRDELLSALQEVIAAADGKGWEQLSPSLENQRRAIERALGGVRVK